MRSRSFTKCFCIVAVTGIIQPWLVATPSREKIDLQNEGIQLIGQVLESAHDIRYDADRLKSFTRATQVSKWTHWHHLHNIKISVNEGLQPAFQRLTEIQPKLPAWKQKRIDDMLTRAKALAADANAAIFSSKSADAPLVLNAEYGELVSRIYQHADALIATAEEARSYAEEKLKSGAE